MSYIEIIKILILSFFFYQSLLYGMGEKLRWRLISLGLEICGGIGNDKDYLSNMLESNNCNKDYLNNIYGRW